MKVIGARQLFGYWDSSKCLIFCSGEGSIWYRFGTTWRWENDDNFNFLGEL